MKHYLTGFFMAWGNFCSLPCPCKRWDNDAKSLMLGFLPSVGLIIGAIWAALYFAAVYFGIPYLVVAFLVTFLPFALCGFMHMDGFMDCCDAIMSRRPLEERQRILKDSNTGAFAVVSMIFLILGYFCFLSTAVTTGVDFANMIMIVVLSRAVSGLHVLICKPMGQSQYAQMQEETEALVNSEETEDIASCETDENAEEPAASKKTTKKQGIILLCILLAIISALAFWSSSYLIATALVSAFTALGCLIAIQYAKKILAA